MDKIRRFRKEKEFEQHFAISVALQYHWEYFKIKDVIPYSESSGLKGVPKSHKRPFDGMLAAPFGNIALEFKIDNGELKKHQWAALRKVRAINGLAFVLRYKWTVRGGEEYRIERPAEKECETEVMMTEVNIERFLYGLEGVLGLIVRIQQQTKGAK